MHGASRPEPAHPDLNDVQHMMPTCFNCSKAVRALGTDDSTLLAPTHQLGIGLSSHLRAPCTALLFNLIVPFWQRLKLRSATLLGNPLGDL